MRQQARACSLKKQIDASFSCVCPVIDHEFRQNIVKVVCRSTRQPQPSLTVRHRYQEKVLNCLSINLLVVQDFFALNRHVETQRSTLLSYSQYNTTVNSSANQKTAFVIER